MILEKIDELKKITVSEKEFSVSLRFFLDNFSGNQEVLRKSQPLKEKNEFFSVLLTPVIKYFGLEVCVNSLCLFVLPNTSLIHGFAKLSNGMIITLYFFEDIQLGMAVSVQPGSLLANYFRLNVFSDEKHGASKDGMPTSIISTTLN